MNEEIEYAQMLEIPVSTVNVVRKKRIKKRKTQDIKQQVLSKVNDKLSEEEKRLEEVLPLVDEDGEVNFSDIPERIDTVRVYATGDNPFDGELQPQEYPLERKETRSERAVRITLTAEFAAACALCAAIFLTNVFMPNSAVNGFFRALSDTAQTTATDNRNYSDFTLSGVVSERSNAALSVSETGVLSFTDACCVYPTVDGTVSELVRNPDGSYTVKLSYSDRFTGVFGGLDQVYYAVGETVKANIPVGYSDGEGEVQVTMYSDGILLNCLTVTEENALVWVEQNA